MSNESKEKLSPEARAELFNALEKAQSKVLAAKANYDKIVAEIAEKAGLGKFQRPTLFNGNSFMIIKRNDAYAIRVERQEVESV